VHFGDAIDIGIRNLDGDVGFFLQPVQDVQAAPATIAAQAVGRIGDMLQFFQHKAWHDECAADKASLADVGNAAIDDGAGVQQNLVRDFAILFAPTGSEDQVAAVAAVLAAFPIFLLAAFACAVFTVTLFALGGAALASSPEAAEEMP